MKYKFILPLFLLFSTANAQENITFQQPSPEILELADYTRPPVVRISPDKEWVLLMNRPTYKSLSELGQEEIRLAGIRTNAKTKISSTETYYDELRLRSTDGKIEYEVQGLPDNPLISNLQFSPDSKKLAFTHTGENGVSLWLLNVETKEVKQLLDYRLNAVLHAPFLWYRDSEKLLISWNQNDHEVNLSNDSLPTGPVVSTSDGQVSQLRTYQDL
ncbi:MAG: hypothetical protein ACTIKE_15710 [Sphingobacterium sp.]